MKQHSTPNQNPKYILFHILKGPQNPLHVRSEVRRTQIKINVTKEKSTYARQECLATNALSTCFKNEREREIEMESNFFQLEAIFQSVNSSSRIKPKWRQPINTGSRNTPHTQHLLKSSPAASSCSKH